MSTLIMNKKTVCYECTCTASYESKKVNYLLKEEEKPLDIVISAM
jgi:hypothetical protein